jgi:GNAT superfamily N-acetyltransferase
MVGVGGVGPGMMHVRRRACHAPGQTPRKESVTAATKAENREFRVMHILSEPVAATLVAATPGDLATLTPLVRAYHAFEGIELDAAVREAGVARLLATPELGRAWLVRVGRENVGYCAVCRGFSLEFGGFDAFVDELFLLPAWRGRGIGGQVLAALPEACRDLELRALHLEVARDNHAARRLYAAAGFRARERFVLMTRDLMAGG